MEEQLNSFVENVKRLIDNVTKLEEEKALFCNWEKRAEEGMQIMNLLASADKCKLTFRMYKWIEELKPSAYQRLVRIEHLLGNLSACEVGDCNKNNLESFSGSPGSSSLFVVTAIREMACVSNSCCVKKFNISSPDKTRVLKESSTSFDKSMDMLIKRNRGRRCLSEDGLGSSFVKDPELCINAVLQSRSLKCTSPLDCLIECLLGYVCNNLDSTKEEQFPNGAHIGCESTGNGCDSQSGGSRQARPKVSTKKNLANCRNSQTLAYMPSSCISAHVNSDGSKKERKIVFQ
ncbi:hypothetical protein HAX54_000621 [Datura stramonium]|uniref:Uncharacterized protein n=1 Tax=Datura stramonium TaxID=4076 RepID=A0ABS8RSA1_DATST|nr:hypothetical protein [Datura stramonium]